MKPCDKWFDEFVVSTEGGLKRYVRTIIASAEDAQEVVQEAYLKVYCVLRNSSANDHAPTALVYTTARNLALSRLRHQKVITQKATAVGVAEELRVSRDSVERQCGRSEKLNSALLAVTQLPPKCREVFVLRMIEGQSHRDIADRLQISVSTVEKHIAKGVRLCRQYIADIAMERQAQQLLSETKAREFGT